MLGHKVTRWLLAAGLVTSGLTVAAAQPPQQAGEQGGGQGMPEGAIEAEQQAQLSGEEQLEQAEKIQKRARQLSRRIQSMLDQARRQGDIIRVTCLNDKLTQVNANRRTLGDRVKNLREAVEANDRDRRNHEYTVITVLQQKFQTLEQQANQCLGQDLYQTGATKVVTDIDPEAPTEDPTVMPEPPQTDVPFIPPPASPTS